MKRYKIQNSYNCKSMPARYMTLPPSLQHLIPTGVKGKSICAQKTKANDTEKAHKRFFSYPAKQILIAPDNMSQFCVAKGKRRGDDTATPSRKQKKYGKGRTYDESRKADSRCNAKLSTRWCPSMPNIPLPFCKCVYSRPRRKTFGTSDASVCAVIETRAFHFGTVLRQYSRWGGNDEGELTFGVCGCKTEIETDRGQIDENVGM